MLPPPVSEPATHQQLTTFQQFTYIIQVQINLTNPQLSPHMTPLLPPHRYPGTTFSLLPLHHDQKTPIVSPAFPWRSEPGIFT